MFHVVLQEPEIPPNTGNIIRLCANSGASLHLIHPLGFRLEDARLRRAGLDYHEYAAVSEHENFAAFLTAVQPGRVYALSTKGLTSYADADFRTGDALVFGPETRGLSPAFLQSLTEGQRLYIPMRPENRSLNLSNAVALVLYEAWRQNGFAGASRL
ncbi:MAG: tRNA (cytidine(34)-2'-O)-methyltransferase [Methylococcaceae bacterium]|nr:tRNA (cytidine(34)-2'-O)-methyltransferase [Methylococcaceae bacterium]